MRLEHALHINACIMKHHRCLQMPLKLMELWISKQDEECMIICICFSHVEYVCSNCNQWIMLIMMWFNKKKRYSKVRSSLVRNNITHVQWGTCFVMKWSKLYLFWYDVCISWLSIFASRMAVINLYQINFKLDHWIWMTSELSLRRLQFDQLKMYFVDSG